MTESQTYRGTEASTTRLSTLPARGSALPFPRTALKEYLRSFCSPGAQFMRALTHSSFLEEVERDLATFDQTIQHLQSQIISMTALQAACQKDREEFSSLYAPIRRLPPELLREIFFYAVTVDGQPGNTFGVYSSWESTAFRLSAVCAHWRIISLETKDLWAYFAVRCCPRALEPAKICLERSKATPISLIITAERYDANGSEVLALLVAQSKRWKFVDYAGLLNLPLRNQLRSGVEETSLLSDAVFHVYDGTSVENPFVNCSPPETFTLRCQYHIDPIPVASFLPLEQVRHLVVQDYYARCFPNLIDVLRICGENLQSLRYEDVPSLDGRNELDIAPWDTPPPLSIAGPITCRVRSLHLDLYGRRGIFGLLSDVFASLTFPDMTHLVIKGDCDEAFHGQWPSVEISQFFARSKCDLTELVLEGMPLSDVEVLSFLQNTPSLVRLRVGETFTHHNLCREGDSIPMERPPVKTVTKTFIESFTFIPSTTTITLNVPFLPKLEDLTLNVHHHFDADSEFIEMVQSRWYPIPWKPRILAEGVSSLRAVTLCKRGGCFDLGAYRPLAKLEKSGMRLVLKVKGYAMPI